MSCFHPLKAFKIGVNPSTGKDILKITSYDTDHVERRVDGHLYASIEADISPFSTVFRDYVDIPCGRCIGCRLSKSREWANRCSVELSYFKYNYFVTFTYDDDHLPINIKDGMESQTLYKRDYQLFMKRLRKEYSKLYPDEKIRFFMCGEYGDKSLRPHYHSILFNLFIPDLKPYKQNFNGDWLYTSEWLSSFWTTPDNDIYKRPSGVMGYVVIGTPDWESIAYTARYVCKKLNGDYSEIYKKFNVEPEFSLMSRKPGIGRQFYEDNKYHLYDQDKFYLEGKNGSRPFTIPKYYRDLYSDEFPDKADMIKKQNKEFADAMKFAIDSSSDLKYLDILRVQEYNQSKRIKALKREL